MPMATVILKPGVNTERTFALNEAGISESQLVRFKDQLIQKDGGFSRFTPAAIGSTIRELWAWRGLQSSTQFLGIGCATLNVIEKNSQILRDITPQTTTTNSTPSFSVTSGSNVVTVVDPNSNVSASDSFFLNTPVAAGGLVFDGAYEIDLIGGSSTYTFRSSTPATATTVSSGFVPIFTTFANSAFVTVTLPNHGYSAITGLFHQFIAPTTVGGITIQGPYTITSIVDSTSFVILVPSPAVSNDTQLMNGNKVQFVHYVTLGPAPAAGGFGIGPYGDGGYGTGTVLPQIPGTPITATDWTLANWGEALLACPLNGAVYVWGPSTSTTVASVITGAPYRSRGIFISQPQQILVCYGSVQSTGVQDPLIVRWSDYGDYTNFVVSARTAAGSFHIPTGSEIIGALQAPYQGVIWTDIDCWTMNYVGGQVIFNFTRVGSGCGSIGPHAAGLLAGTVFWCGLRDFFMLGPQGVTVIPCTVWDAIFQNINPAHQTKVRCAPNSVFHEITWYYPSINATENDSYVRLNIMQQTWDYGKLSRTAWTDVSVLGNPVGAEPSGLLQVHETGQDADTAPMVSSFRTGYWKISEGNDLFFVDFIIPDMKFVKFPGSPPVASIQITFFALDYPGDTEKQYGPYTFTNTTEYINTRIRARFLAMKISSADSGSFWRLGGIRYRAAPAGRR